MVLVVVVVEVNVVLGVEVVVVVSEVVVDVTVIVVSSIIPHGRSPCSTSQRAIWQCSNVRSLDGRNATRSHLVVLLPAWYIAPGTAFRSSFGVATVVMIGPHRATFNTLDTPIPPLTFVATLGDGNGTIVVQPAVTRHQAIPATWTWSVEVTIVPPLRFVRSVAPGPANTAVRITTKVVISSFWLDVSLVRKVCIPSLTRIARGRRADTCVIDEIALLSNRCNHEK